MRGLLFLALLVICSSITNVAANEFKGSSKAMKHFLGLSGLIGFGSGIIMAIFAMFIDTWWVVLLVWLASMFLSGPIIMPLLRRMYPLVYGFISAVFIYIFLFLTVNYYLLQTVCYRIACAFL